MASFELTVAGLAPFQSWQSYSDGGGLSGVELLTLSQGSDSRTVAIGPGLAPWMGHDLSPSTGLGTAVSLAPADSSLPSSYSAVFGLVGPRAFALSSTAAAITSLSVQVDMTLDLARSHLEVGADFAALALTPNGLLLAADKHSNELLSYRVSDSGALTLVDRAGGENSAGFSLLALLPDGRLLHQDSPADELSVTLDNPSGGDGDRAAGLYQFT